MLDPARRWALRELKIHRGQTVLVAGCPVTWTVALVQELVGADGQVVVVEGDARRADRVAGAAVRKRWRNVRVLVGVAAAAELPHSAARVFVDDQALLARADAVALVLAPLGSAGRVAAALPARTAVAGLGEIERRVHTLRREPFYFGAVLAVWGQLP